MEEAPEAAHENDIETLKLYNSNSFFAIRPAYLLTQNKGKKLTRYPSPIAAPHKG